MFPNFSLLEKIELEIVSYLDADMKEKIIFFALLSLACAHIDLLPWQYPPDYCMYCKRIMKLIDNLATGTLPFTIDRLRNATGNLCSLIENPTLLNYRATVSSLRISSLIQGCWKFGYRDMARSSRPEVFCKKGILRNFAKFTGKHLCQSLFLIKLQEHIRWLLLYGSVNSQSFNSKSKKGNVGV